MSENSHHHHSKIIDEIRREKPHEGTHEYVEVEMKKSYDNGHQNGLLHGVLLSVFIWLILSGRLVDLMHLLGVN